MTKYKAIACTANSDCLPGRTPTYPNLSSAQTTKKCATHNKETNKHGTTTKGYKKETRFALPSTADAISAAVITLGTVGLPTWSVRRLRRDTWFAQSERALAARGRCALRCVPRSESKAIDWCGEMTHVLRYAPRKIANSAAPDCARSLKKLLNLMNDIGDQVGVEKWYHQCISNGRRRRRGLLR